MSFSHFKAFSSFNLHLRSFNILVGPNNAGKSTILAAFRILSAAIRRASSRNPEAVNGPRGPQLGYAVDISAISVAEENIFYNYDNSQPATIRFKLSNGIELVLYFPERGKCIMIVETVKGRITSPSQFKSQCRCSIGSVPILGPVDHDELLYEKEAAYNALFNNRAARNFRNIWYHYPQKFEEFRKAISRTWPGMDIEFPTVDHSHGKARLIMFCLENRITREIFWSGFGFQVWCQMLTHLIQAGDRSLFLIDEPDIYLHSDLQRQLIGILRDLGPDILIATHSTEMITEAEPEDILLINKSNKRARRIDNSAQLSDVFRVLGSSLNPILTQLAKTRRVIFVEGKDFQIISRFARKLNISNVGNRGGFAVVPIEGFNPDRVRSLKTGMETTLGAKISAAIILDRDYRAVEECASYISQCQEMCDLAYIHDCKEIENYLLVPPAIDRAVLSRAADNERRGGRKVEGFIPFLDIFERYAASVKTEIMAQHLSFREKFERQRTPHLDKSTINKRTLEDFEARWQEPTERLKMLPGKEALSYFNREMQSFGISVTPTAIIDSMHIDEIPEGIKSVVKKLSEFASI